MADKKEFDKGKIISAKRLATIMKDKRKGKKKFCFILGSGASVESGIPTGITLIKQWMKELLEMATVDDICNIEATIKLKKKLKFDFRNEILPKWENKEVLGSEYYFDVYSLRFYPDPTDGYYFYEEKFSKAVPSFGYNALAQILADSLGSNLVITTNFDSLVEDALFIYTDKKPLVINHEALAGYAADFSIDRPVIAKVHRGLYFDPLNTPEETDELKGRWAEILGSVFKYYTPVVIGYGGGDESLMRCLEDPDVKMENGIYWCYRKKSGLPDERILKLITDKNGLLVRTAGFDSVMLALGNALAPKEIEPQNVGDYLKKQCDDRVSGYEKHYNKLIKESLEEDKLGKSKPESESEREFKEETKELDKRVEDTENSKPTDELTAWDYFRKGNRAVFDENDYDKAIEYYGKAIELNPEYAEAYTNRGNAYGLLNEYDKAIDDYSKAIELNPELAEAYNNRGTVYEDLKKYDKAREDYNKAIKLNPEYAEAYYNRGNAYACLKEYDKAIEDYSKAIELNPKYAKAYYNRGHAYVDLKEYDKAIEDYSKAIELNPENAKAYYSRGFAYSDLEEYDKAIDDFSKAMELNPEDAELYYFRAKAYEAIGETEKAKADKEMSEKLKAKQGDSDDSD
ncbi:MAG: tetratricopeptide repeat protein [Ruminococcus sp.]|nr:tetratricopeptide repeat protein [Ruminococcus sp.]